MATSNGNVASGLLLVLLGVWLLLQTVAGDLPRRLLSLTGATSSKSSGSGLLGDIAGGLAAGPTVLRKLA